MELLFFWLIMGGVVAIIAGSKGFAWFPWLLYGAVIWPIALVHVLVRRPDTAPTPIPVVITEGVTARPLSPIARAPAPTLKTCPMCAEQVQAAARICRFCRHEFAPEPEPAAAPAGKPRTGHIPFGMKACRNCQELNWHDAKVCTSCGAALRVSGA